MEELVTIVVPVYNAEKYLKKCLDSLINQTYNAIEIIAINDGSKDNSLNILKDYVNIDNRIIIFDQKNIGAALTRNRGLELAKGKYITFVDSDDWVEKEYIEILLKAYKPKCDIIISGYQKYYNNKILFHMPSMCEWDVYKFSATLGKMYKVDFLKNNNNFYKKRLIMEDVEFNINCFINGATYKTINYAGYIYNINDTSVTSTSTDKHEQLLNVIKLFKEIDITAKNKANFIYQDHKENLINFYILHYMFIINMCCKKAKYQFLNNTTKEFIIFLNSIDVKWYKIKNPIGENKKNLFAIKLFKFIFRYKIQSIFFLMYSMKNKIKNNEKG